MIQVSVWVCRTPYLGYICIRMPYLDCRNCRLTVYAASVNEAASDCPRCGGRLGSPARLFQQVRRIQRSIGRPRTLPRKRRSVP